MLATGAFVVTCDGTLVVGLLRQIGETLSVSPAAAGQAVTVFAVVYALVLRAIVVRDVRGMTVDVTVAWPVPAESLKRGSSAAVMLGSEHQYAARKNRVASSAGVSRASTDWTGSAPENS